MAYERLKCGGKIFTFVKKKAFGMTSINAVTPNVIFMLQVYLTSIVALQFHSQGVRVTRGLSVQSHIRWIENVQIH